MRLSVRLLECAVKIWADCMIIEVFTRSILTHHISSLSHRHGNFDVSKLKIQCLWDSGCRAHPEGVGLFVNDEVLNMYMLLLEVGVGPISN